MQHLQNTDAEQVELNQAYLCDYPTSTSTLRACNKQ